MSALSQSGLVTEQMVGRPHDEVPLALGDQPLTPRATVRLVATADPTYQPAPSGAVRLRLRRAVPQPVHVQRTELLLPAPSTFHVIRA